MTEMTVLDKAHAAMLAAPDDDAARLRFYERLADCELFLMLDHDAGGDAETVIPTVFEHDGARYVLVFDREERLVAFSGAATPYVALSGRSVVEMLEAQDIGLGINLDVAPSSILLAAASVAWLGQTLMNAPDEVEARIAELTAPAGLPENLVQAIDTKLTTAMGLASVAYLVGVVFVGGLRGHMLVFVGSPPEAREPLARAASEALTFSGVEAGAMDVAFFEATDPMVERLNRVGLRFDLPQLQQSVASEPAAPGSDPENPPKLK